MSKYKIEITIDVDFQKYFDEIPEGLYKEKNGPDDYYEIEAIHKALRNSHQHSLFLHMKHLASEETYPYAKHHLLIEDELCKQISENSKISKIE